MFGVFFGFAPRLSEYRFFLILIIIDVIESNLLSLCLEVAGPSPKLSVPG